MRGFLAAAWLLASLVGGCLGDSPSDPPKNGETSSDPSFLIDVLASGPDQMRVVAFQANGPANVNVTTLQDLRGEKRGDTACFFMQSLEGTPVETLQAWQRGELSQPPPGAAGDLAWGFVSGTNPRFSAGGQAVGETAAEFGWSAPVPLKAKLSPGSWLVLAAGSAGLDLDRLDAGSHWTVAVRADAPLTMVDLGNVPVACGMGFRDLAGGSYAGGLALVGSQQGGSWSAQSPFGGTAYGIFLDSTMQAVGDVSVGLGAVSLDWPSELGRQVTVDGPAELSLDVTSWTGYDMLWYITGLWCP